MQPLAGKNPALAVVLASLFPLPVLWGSETPQAKPSESPEKVSPSPSTAPKAVPDRAALEKEFKEMLTGVTLRGTWQMTGEGGLTGTASLTPAQEDSYTILGVVKGQDDFWIVNARIKFGDKDVTVPVPVRVVWAEDTPVMTLNELAIPGIGTYSARVMFFKGFYCGTWFSGERNYGGVMSGKIFRDAPGSDSNQNSKEK